MQVSGVTLARLGIWRWLEGEQLAPLWAGVGFPLVTVFQADH